MARQYHTLVELGPDGVWTIQFGDYVKSVAKTELDDQKYEQRFKPKAERCALKLISHPYGLKAQLSAVAALNAETLKGAKS